MAHLRKDVSTGHLLKDPTSGHLSKGCDPDCECEGCDGYVWLDQVMLEVDGTFDNITFECCDDLNGTYFLDFVCSTPGCSWSLELDPDVCSFQTVTLAIEDPDTGQISSVFQRTTPSAASLTWRRFDFLSTDNCLFLTPYVFTEAHGVANDFCRITVDPATLTISPPPP